MNSIRHLDTMSHAITVEAGCILENIQQAAERRSAISAQFRLPRNLSDRRQSLHQCGGLNVVRYGNARSLCLGLEVVTADGRVMTLATEGQYKV